MSTYLLKIIESLDVKFLMVRSLLPDLNAVGQSGSVIPRLGSLSRLNKYVPGILAESDIQ